MLNHMILRFSRLLLSSSRRNYAHRKASVATQFAPYIEEKKYIDYDSYLKISKPGNQSKDALLQLLHIGKMSIDDIAKKYPKLTQIPPKDILNNYQILINYGVSRQTIRENPLLLVHTHSELLTKIEVISKFGLDFDHGILFGILSLRLLKIFRKYCEQEKYMPVDKINLFCKLFQQDTKTVCLLFRKHKHLRTLSLSVLKAKVELLLANGFTSKVIIADASILANTLYKIKTNIEFLSQYDLKEKKSWMIRSSISDLEKHISRHNLYTKIDGKETELIEYLGKRLNCDETTAQLLIVRNPNIAKMNIDKVKQIFDVLDEYKIRPDQILCGSLLFTRSVKTLKDRLMRVRDKFGCIPHRISFLHMTHKNFDKYVNQETTD